MSVVRLPAAVTLRRSLIALCGVLFAIGLAACGHQSPHQNFADADNDGDYISAGYITYQLQISRELNQYGSEDSPVRQGPAPRRVAEPRARPAVVRRLPVGQEPERAPGHHQ